ncbi:MAG: response regulator transcription factor [Flavobacteriaceae bacterium]|nr:response regulator transcription factor [Flavobacteriaceae bacterium]
MNPSIIIADDHPLVLKGLKDFLVEKAYNVIGCAKDGKEALELLLKHKPDIAILDIMMPEMNGLEVAESCRKQHLDTKVVLITFEKNPMLFNKGRESNIFGYILKEFALTEIEICLETVHKGEPYLSPEIDIHFNPPTYSLIETLTPSEKTVLRLVGDNQTATQIAKTLHISHRTVEKHKSHIIKKLKLESKSNSLILFAKEHDLF